MASWTYHCQASFDPWLSLGSFCVRGSVMPGPRPEYSWAERQRRAQVVREWRSTQGDICPGYQRPPHAVDYYSNPLTADHVAAVGAGGPEDGPLQVLCRSCNATKRDGRRRRVTRIPRESTPDVASRRW